MCYDLCAVPWEKLNKHVMYHVFSGAVSWVLYGASQLCTTLNYRGWSVVQMAARLQTLVLFYNLCAPSC
jgi:hypothetical protein